MTRLPDLAVLAGFVCSLAMLHAQEQPVERARDQSPRPDVNLIQNIYVPPIPHAPFTAIVLSSTTGKNNLILSSTAGPNNLRSYSRIARDSSGRIFEERRSYVTTDFRGVSTYRPSLNAPSPGPHVTRLLYIDPTKRVAYECTADDHVCRISPYDFSSTGTEPKKVVSGAGVTVKSLGQKEIHGLGAVGSREVTSQPLDDSSPSGWALKEFWYSPDLQINLITKRKSAVYHSESIVVQSIKRHEPDPKLFVPPASYKIISAGLPGQSGAVSKAAN